MSERREDEPGLVPDDDTPLGDTSEHSDVPSDENAPSPVEHEGSERLEDEDESDEQ
jgi:hypothetical protein